MALKKPSRKQLLKEPDEFITFSGKLIRLGVAYKFQLAAVSGVFLAALVAFSLWGYFNEKAENQASIQLGHALQQYETAQQQVSLPADTYAAVKEAFEALLEAYPHRRAGEIGGLILANIALKAEDYDQAIELYQKARKDFSERPYLMNMIHSGLGYAYEARSENQKAIHAFEKTTASACPLYQDEALFNLGRLYRKNGDNAKSTASYQKIVTDYSDSIFLELAKDKIAG